MTPDPTPSEAAQGLLKAGDRVLKYEIQRAIGRGGHARVYHAYDPFLGRHVALKILHRPGGVTDDMLRRGQAEAQLLTRLRHPNIVEVIDAGLTERGDLYIVMELLRGLSFREVLRRQSKLAIEEVLTLFPQIADGVEAAHQKKAIHRDLKPENVFVIENNSPKVLDFGIAKVMDSAGTTTRKDIVLGTMLYMSPEQLQGFGVTPRSDVFALGVMMYEALLGKHPSLLDGEASSPQELAWRQATQVPPLLDSLDPAFPRYVGRLVNRAITKLPEQRFESMEEFARVMREALERYVHDLSNQGVSPIRRDLSRAGSAEGVPGAPPITNLSSKRSPHAEPGAGSDTEAYEGSPPWESGPSRVGARSRDNGSSTQSVPPAAPNVAEAAREQPRFRVPDGPYWMPEPSEPRAYSSITGRHAPPRPQKAPSRTRRVLIASVVVGVLLGAGVAALRLSRAASPATSQPAADGNRTETAP